MSASSNTTTISSTTSTNSLSTSSIHTSTTPTATSTSSPSTSSSSLTSSSTSSLKLITSTSTFTETNTSTSSAGGTTTITSTSTNVVTESESSTTSSAAAATTTAGSGSLANPSSAGTSTTTPPSTIAVATVIPIVAVALLILAGLWFWRKRKERKNAEEMRRKEMEEYGFNPNNDPTLPATSTNGDEVSTMRERDAGYRGWGTTSTARKASTTMSSQPGMARSDSDAKGFHGQPSPPVGIAQSDGHSGDPFTQRGNDGIAALGAVPAAAQTRSNGINRGPSNASSAYSGANYSDASVDGPLPNGAGQDYGGYVDEHGHSPYGEGAWGGQPVIRDVSARRNTRIENPSVVPHQGNSGISQNF